MQKSFSSGDISHAVAALTYSLQLRRVEGSDWAIEAADPLRLTEFCEFYRFGDLSDTEKFVLMELVVASLDDYLNTTLPGYQNPNLSEEVRQLLKSDFALHKPTIAAWCHFNDDLEDADDAEAHQGSHGELEKSESRWAFHISPLMRRIWEEYPHDTKK